MDPGDRGWVPVVKERLVLWNSAGLSDFIKHFMADTDASEVGLGAVLSQRLGGEEHPVCCQSMKLTWTEARYQAIEQECLSINWALESLRCYFLGREFTVVTDLAPLQWLHPQMEGNVKLWRGTVSLNPFRFKVQYHLDASHHNVDVLSRMYRLS